MLYVLTKYVEAISAAEAIAKDKTTPIHEIDIHSKVWEHNNFELNAVKKEKNEIGYKPRRSVSARKGT